MRLFIAFLLVAGSPAALAFDFSAADAVFARREEGVAVIAQARQAYIAAVPEIVGEELVYAIEQTSRLDAYEALAIPTASIKDRKPVLERCIADIEKLAPSASVIATPHYYYWKATCHSLWAEADGVMSSLNKAKEFFRWLDQGRAIDQTYEAGGFDRVAGGLYSKLPPVNPFGPSGSIPKALEHLERALNAPAYGGSRNPETDSGDFHFVTHFYYGETLIKAGREEDAKEFLDSTIERIEGGDLPVGREPEARLAAIRLKEVRSRIQ